VENVRTSLFNHCFVNNLGNVLEVLLKVHVFHLSSVIPSSFKWRVIQNTCFTIYYNFIFLIDCLCSFHQFWIKIEIKLSVK
jgi:hypothetical protein